MSHTAPARTRPFGPSFNIQRVYLKDLSVEQSNSPDIFLELETPAVDVVINITVSRLAEHIFEIVLTLTMTARIKDIVTFLIEAQQAGIFDIHHMPQTQIERLLGIACPTILFPYLRANVADILARAGFPPVHLSEINFQALYEQRAAQVSQPNGMDTDNARQNTAPLH